MAFRTVARFATEIARLLVPGFAPLDPLLPQARFGEEYSFNYAFHDQFDISFGQIGRWP
jgi:hypothetical protein